MSRYSDLGPVGVALLVLTTAFGAIPTPPRPSEPFEEAAILQCVSWVSPVYPREAIDKKLQGSVMVRFIINEAGIVTSARVISTKAAVFVEPALTAVRQWRFVPIIEESRPVAKCVDAKLPFQLADLNDRSDPARLKMQVIRSLAYGLSTPAVRTVGGDPEYPESLLRRQLAGQVLVDFSVNPEGRVASIKILSATHTDFVPPALAAAERWLFRPAMQGDLPVVTPPQRASMDFTYFRAEGETLDVLASNGVSLAKTDNLATLDRLPKPVVVVDPIYPYDQLLTGTEGEATADFAIGADGQVEWVTVLNATQPVFGLALAAAIECWRFEPASKHGTNVAVLATMQRRFYLMAKGATGAARSRLAGQLRHGDIEGMAAKGLDARLNPRYREPPAYPAKLLSEKLAGEAEIAFIIDREGHCRLARIVSATHELFGWAAATAVERWVFDPPKRGGQPADVRVTIPFTFDPPK
jgi:TonB family protein